MEETTAEPIDELIADEHWPTPRGPHLPDALGVLPGPAWVFVLLAVGRFAWGLREADVGPVLDLWRVAQLVLFAIPSVVAVLLPAALFARHPDAFTRARLLLVGTVLLALVEGLVILREPLGPIFERLTAAGEGVPFLTPAAVAYGVLIDVISSLGLIAIGAGLGRARRYEDRGETRAMVLIIVVAAVLTSAGRIVLFSQQAFGELQMTPTLAVFLGSGVVLGIVGIAALAYLAIELIRGALAGEEPWLGWGLGALGAGLIVAAMVLITAISFVVVVPEGQTGFSDVVYVWAGIQALGWLGLLGALALGLPALGEVGEQEEQEEADDAEPRPAET